MRRSFLMAAAVPSVEAAGEAAANLPRLYSMLVSHGGELILERYYHGARANRTANIKSASKSMISALVGIAIERGLIESVRAPIAQYFPDELGANADPRKRTITIGDLLTMRSGLETTSNRNYGVFVQSRNWVRHILSRPMVSDPGTERIYSTGNSHLLSAILTKVSGKSTWEFACEVLAAPMEIELTRWPQDPQGIYFGGNDMEMTSRQMVTFGEMYLNGGRVGDRQVVPEEWVLQSWIPRVRTRRGGRYYGYSWWIGEMAGYRTCYAWGYGGQFIFVVPYLDLVVVTTSSPVPGVTRRGHIGDIRDVVEDRVVRPVAQKMVKWG